MCACIPSSMWAWKQVLNYYYRTCICVCFRFDGRVVAKLPFVPISLLQNLSHRNLLGDDFTDCSFIFLYILCTMSIRQVGTLFFHLLANFHLLATKFCPPPSRSRQISRENSPFQAHESTTRIYHVIIIGTWHLQKEGAPCRK